MPLKVCCQANNIKTVIIGKQLWMAENLNVDKFRNGDPIPQVKNNKDWGKFINSKKPAWCYYENKIENGVKYCKLYNWYAVNDSWEGHLWYNAGSAGQNRFKCQACNAKVSIAEKKPKCMTFCEIACKGKKEHQWVKD